MRLRYILLLIVAVSLPVVLVGEIVEEIAAKVNGDVITKSELERSRQQLRQELEQQYAGQTLQLQAAYAEREKDLLRDLIDQDLLVQRGKDLTVDVNNDLVKRLDKIRKDMGLTTLDDLEKAVNAQGGNFEDFKNGIKNQLITQQVIGREVGSHIQIKGDRIKQYYEDNKQKLERPEEVRIRQILISTEGKEGPDLLAAEKKANEVLDKVKKGGNFADLASQYSDGPTAKSGGGDVGFFPRGQMAKEIEDVAFSLKRGETSGVIRSKYGYLIIKVEEKHTAGVPPLADVEQDIQEVLYMQDIQPAYREFLNKLRQEAYIEIKAGYTDTGAVANQSYARLIPQDISEDELIAPKGSHKRRSILRPWRKKG